MKLLVGLMLVVCLLSACAGPLHYRGTKLGAGQTEFSNDFLECQAVATRIHGYAEVYATRTCMQGKGWSMTEPTDAQIRLNGLLL